MTARHNTCVGLQPQNTAEIHFRGRDTDIHEEKYVTMYVHVQDGRILPRIESMICRILRARDLSLDALAREKTTLLSTSRVVHCHDHCK